METGSLIASLFEQLWRLWSVQSPFFGLTYAQIFIGVFVVRYLIKIFKFIFVPDMSGSKDKGSEKQNE